MSCPKSMYLLTMDLWKVFYKICLSKLMQVLYRKKQTKNNNNKTERSVGLSNEIQYQARAWREIGGTIYIITKDYVTSTMPNEWTPKIPFTTPEAATTPY